MKWVYPEFIEIKNKIKENKVPSNISLFQWKICLIYI